MQKHGRAAQPKNLCPRPKRLRARPKNLPAPDEEISLQYEDQSQRVLRVDRQKKP